MIRIWRLTIHGQPPHLVAGDRNAIMDMAYDNGALGVTLIEAEEFK